jgi:hypothetical protein
MKMLTKVAARAQTRKTMSSTSVKTSSLLMCFTLVPRARVTDGASPRASCALNT